MLFGKKVTLRLIQESDLDLLADYLGRSENRVPFYPVTISTRPSLERTWRDDGFWKAGEGHLAIADPQGRLVGEILHFSPHPVTHVTEIAYIIFDVAARNLGYATEALGLFYPFLFRTMPIHRVELTIGLENVASLRVAQKNGFTPEGVARELWYSPTLDRYLDAVRYSRLRRELPPGDLNVPESAEDKGGLRCLQ